MHNEYREDGPYVSPTPIGPDSGQVGSRPVPGEQQLEPSRAGLVLFFGLISLIACWPLGIAAWIMGNSHLAKMRAGRMSADTKSTVQVGRVCGIIGTLAFVGMLVAAVVMIPREMPDLKKMFTREPLTPEQIVYAGKWTGNYGTTITIRPNGSADYKAANSRVTGGSVELEGEQLSIGLFGLSKTWHIDEAPKLIQGRWIMKLDGETFSKKAEGVTA